MMYIYQIIPGILFLLLYRKFAKKYNENPDPKKNTFRILFGFGGALATVGVFVILYLSSFYLSGTLPDISKKEAIKILGLFYGELLFSASLIEGYFDRKYKN